MFRHIRGYKNTRGCRSHRPFSPIDCSRWISARKGYSQLHRGWSRGGRGMDGYRDLVRSLEAENAMCAGARRN